MRSPSGTSSKTTTTAKAKHLVVHRRARAESGAFLLSAKSFVWSPRNQSDETLFPKFPDEEEANSDESRWFDCLHLDCIGNRPYSARRPSAATAVIDFLLAIMIALIACYFLLSDCLIGLSLI